MSSFQPDDQVFWGVILYPQTRVSSSSSPDPMFLPPGSHFLNLSSALSSVLCKGLCMDA